MIAFILQKIPRRKKALPTRPVIEDPEGVVQFSLSADKVDQYSKSEQENYVIGEIPFDVNDRQNCLWMPSHCAIANWSEVKLKDAWHEDQDSDKDKPIEFQVAYAYNTMKHAGKQFHDSHGDYSREVIRLLKKIDVELQRLADACLLHPDTKSKNDGPYPAPSTLTPALYKLASLLADELDIEKTTPVDPYYTSKLSLKVADLVS